MIPSAVAALCWVTVEAGSMDGASGIGVSLKTASWVSGGVNDIAAGFVLDGDSGRDIMAVATASHPLMATLFLHRR